VDADDPAVALILFPSSEAVLLEPVDDPRHRRWADLLCGGELAERLRPGEDEDGERREPGGAEAARAVLACRIAKRVDRRRMKAVGCI
jgi:hypothetical protein